MFDQGRGLVPLRQKYVKILSGMLPAGAVGMSLLLGSTPPSVANEHPTASQPSASKDRLSERLAAIREAVSAVAEPGGTAAKPDDRNHQLAWGNWWGGGWGGYYPYGYGWPNWNNWHNWNNWNNFWRNW
jgi:hypothetical protein